MVRLILVLLSTAVLASCSSPPPPVALRADVPLAPDTTITHGFVPRDSTLETMLMGEGLPAEAVQGVISAVRTVFDPRRLRSQQPYSLERAADGALRRFEYEIDPASTLRVQARLDEGGLAAEVVPIPVTIVPDTASGAIDDMTPSLFQSIEASGERPDLAIAMAQIFAGEIDFNTELQPGDRYTIAFERLERQGRPSTYGAITAAEFQNDGRVIRAIRFTPAGGSPGYYDERGRSLKRFFLRSPLKFEPRITSGFTTSRMHPVLHLARAHRGVDYGAPVGAEVVSVASGRVLSATYDQTNGRMVRVRHPSGYVSYYLHLSAFGSGVRAGAAVAQGQTIGRVGSTGLATGPHLHYGLEKNGVFVNPLTEHRNMPPGEPVPESDLEAFSVERDRAMAIFAGAVDTRDVETDTVEAQ